MIETIALEDEAAAMSGVYSELSGSGVVVRKLCTTPSELFEFLMCNPEWKTRRDLVLLLDIMLPGYAKIFVPEGFLANNDGIVGYSTQESFNAGLVLFEEILLAYFESPPPVVFITNISNIDCAISRVKHNWAEKAGVRDGDARVGCVVKGAARARGVSISDQILSYLGNWRLLEEGSRS